MIYAVIDTNVFVSSFIGKNPDSAPKRIVKMVLDGTIIPLYDADVIAEYREVLTRKKFKIDRNRVNEIIDYIEAFGIASDRKSFEEYMPDESDRVFYEITLSFEDSFLVTGNLKHYPHKPNVVTPSEMLTIIQESRICDKAY